MPSTLRKWTERAASNRQLTRPNDREWRVLRPLAKELGYSAQGPSDLDPLVDQLETLRASFVPRRAHKPDEAFADDESARTEVPRSELAGEAWQGFWQGERERQLARLEEERSELRAFLGLKAPLAVDDVYGFLVRDVGPVARAIDPRPDDIFEHSWSESVQYLREALGLAPWPPHTTWQDRLDRESTDEDDGLGCETYLFSLRIPLVSTDPLANKPYPPSPERRLYEGRLVFPDSNERFGRLYEATHQVVSEVRCREAEAVAWLLCDELPPRPLLSITSKVERHRRGPQSWRYTIEIGSHLVPPEEVAELYRSTRDRDAWSGEPPVSRTRRPSVWTTELVRFVQTEAPRGRKPWTALLDRFTQRYPQKSKPYTNARAMKQSYSEALAREKRRSAKEPSRQGEV